MAFLHNTLILFGLFLVPPFWQVWAKVRVIVEEKIEVSVGGMAEIPCNYHFSEKPNTVLTQWFVSGGSLGQRQRIYYSDNVTHIVDKGTDYTGRIAISAFGPEGDSSILTIRDIGLSDERDFICQVNGMSLGSSEGKTRLNVFDPPESPVIEGVNNGISVTSENPSKIATCEARNGYPRPNITWYRNQSPLLPVNGVVNFVTLVTKESSNLYTVQSELHYKVSREDSDAVFHCEVTFRVPGGVRSSESGPTNVTVHYPTTDVKIWKKSPEGLVKEGDTVEIRCLGDGNPPPLYSFNRIQQSEEDLDSTLDLLVLQKVTRADSGMYQCRSVDLDTYEEAVGEMQLNVHYLDPAVVVPRESEVLSKGESLTATCNALSSVDTVTVWFKDGKKVADGHTMVLQDATFDTAGDYVCEVTAPSLGGLQTSSSVHILVTGAPEVHDPEYLTMEVSVEKSVNLTCNTRGFPKPTLTWSITGTQNWREVLNRETENNVHSVVTVKVTSDITALCNSTNKMGSDVKYFSIRAIPSVTSHAHSYKDGSGVIIVVLIVCILLLAILGSVLYFLYKKGKIPCGRSGKQDISKEKASTGDIVVEMKSDKAEEAVLLKGVNTSEKSTNEQSAKPGEPQD